jgi:hypothetical protein
MTPQLALYESTPVARPAARSRETIAPVCAACRAREARYGFRDDDDPQTPRAADAVLRMLPGRNQPAASRRGANGAGLERLRK